jgi:hypothetical protein
VASTSACSPTRREAFLARFADNGIETELGVWIGDPEIGTLNIRSEINLAIWRVSGSRYRNSIRSAKCGFAGRGGVGTALILDRKFESLAKYPIRYVEVT